MKQAPEYVGRMDRKATEAWGQSEGLLSSSMSGRRTSWMSMDISDGRETLGACGHPCLLAFLFFAVES